jgi:hypothetical protein
VNNDTKINYTLCGYSQKEIVQLKLKEQYIVVLEVQVQYNEKMHQASIDGQQ